MPSYRTQAEISFQNGLVTERSELTQPENTTVDELNMTLDVTNARRRRLACQLESGTDPTPQTYNSDQVTSVGTWENVGGNPDIEFTVVQAGSFIRLYDKSYDKLSDGLGAVNYDMSVHNRPGGNGAASAPIQVASVKGALVVVSPEINAFYIERDNDTQVYTYTEIEFKIRDYEWVGDTDDYYTREFRDRTDLNWLREYDTRNAGWSNPENSYPYYIYFITTGRYPPLSVPWFSGKDSSDNFSVTEFNKLADQGFNSLIANGHFILDLYSGNRQSVMNLGTGSLYTFDTDVTQIPNIPESSRFSCVAAYAGRVFFSGLGSERNSGRVFYSQTLTSLNEIGNLHTINDPTAEFYADPLDTDGGYVDIENAYGVRYLYENGNTLLIFAKNGIWALDGVDGVFRSTEYRLNFVSDVGIASAQSFAAVDGVPYWWTDEGIYGLLTDQLGNSQVTNITRPTIQTFFLDIGAEERAEVRAVTDEQNKRIFWCYPDDGASANDRSEFLILDTDLNAFYPWSVVGSDTTPTIVGLDYFRGSAAQEATVQITTNAGVGVVDSGGNPVTVTRTQEIFGSSGTRINVLTMLSTGALQWAEFTGTDFLDWGTENYTSFLESRYNLGGDPVLYKTSPYIVFYLGQTETGWELNDAGDGYDPIRESSCFGSVFWDWKTTQSSRLQQLYRLKYPPVVDETDLGTYDYPHTVIQTRVKCRGRGRAMHIRVESEQGKDFKIIGWGIVGEGSSRW